MQLSGFGRRALTMAVATAILSGCGAQNGASAVPQGAMNAQAHKAVKPCYGTHGVKAVRCPVELRTHRPKGIQVVGPRVGQAHFIGSCGPSNEICHVRPLGIPTTQFSITSGPDCGTVELKFEGDLVSGKRVGYAYAELTNKHCP